ncbi:MAG: FAD:protein FMN transferase [Firmicutes bacterium]|nr:FAD:protein FMN transferase [Bacillota bacterium]
MKDSIYNKISIFLMLLTFISLNTVGCSNSGPHQKTVFIMDTSVDIVVHGASKKQAKLVMEKAVSKMEQLEKILSGHISGSDVSRINEAAGRAPVKVRSETIYAVRKALKIAELSKGAFDPTVGPLLELWGWGTEKLRVPSTEEINKVLPLVDYKAVKIDENSSTIFLTKPGMKLDLGGIAKGYIVDQGQEAVKEMPFKAMFINAGGDISIPRNKPSGEKWTIAIQSPHDPQSWAAVLEIEKGCVATSGGYERYFEEDGEIYHHILDPKKGVPGKKVAGVTVVAPDAAWADALATATFILGKQEGMQLLESLEGVEGVIIDNQGEVQVSTGLKDNITVMSK